MSIDSNPTEISLPAPVTRRGISEAQWRTLMNNLYPGAAPESVCMVWDYCVARKLDPLKKPCHIVPMQVKDARSGNKIWRDVVMPGIYEYRTTAIRTGLYVGHSKPDYGPSIEHGGGNAPEWCEMTMYRWNPASAARSEFPVRVYFKEAAGLYNGELNSRWRTAPIQMLTKCCEAAGLREAFPDEFGGTHTVEELAGQVLEAEITKGDNSGRPDTGMVDWTERDKWVGMITDTLNADQDEYAIADAARSIDDELMAFPELYTTVLDYLAAQKIISKSKWRELLKHQRPAEERIP